MASFFISKILVEFRKVLLPGALPYLMSRLYFNSLLLRVGLKSKQPTMDKMFSVHLGLSVKS